MQNFILIIDIILAVLLIGAILLQKSEGGALGLGVSEQDSFISARSASSFLTKATAIIATLFIITSISLTIMSREQLTTSSVLETIEETSEETSDPEIPKSE
jgi:preprotein translocase subunit SecG